VFYHGRTALHIATDLGLNSLCDLLLFSKSVRCLSSAQLQGQAFQHLQGFFPPTIAWSDALVPLSTTFQFEGVQHVATRHGPSCSALPTRLRQFFFN
jgi:hypothetical protein